MFRFFVYGETATEFMKTLPTRAKITVEGAQLVLRGKPTKEDWHQPPRFGIFKGLQIPARRLTPSEGQRLLRRMP